MEQEHLTTADLLPVFGTRGRTSAILQKRRRMSLDVMRALNKRIGIPLEVLAREYKLKNTRSKKSAKKARRKAA
jgi:HTH-type transcriptional regulator/antitoxin HigA